MFRQTMRVAPLRADPSSGLPGPSHPSTGFGAAGEGAAIVAVDTISKPLTVIFRLEPTSDGSLYQE
jgi:hypothetical protein